ncbi:MAG: hypothetical protein ACE5GE_01585 [Phycisphaerae bacterium]
MTAVETMLAGQRVHWTGGPQTVRSRTPETFTFRCGGCGAELNWPTGRRGRRAHLHCPECRRRLRLPKAQRAGCPSCGKLVSRSLPPQHASMQCGHCGVAFKSNPPLASAASRRVGRSSNRRRTDAVAALVAFSIVMVFVLLGLLMWIL